MEQVDPLIVTVDFAKEGSEYARDSYKTVTLTSAKLSIRLPDGTTENRTLNLTTDVSTPDNIKFTFPLLNPKIGAYTMTVQAMDQAGNTQVNSTADLKASWDVVKPKPVNIDLAPGWNLISLPFQPANPAINSVIPADHPADIVMTYDNTSQIWMVSRRDAESGLFVGDITVLSANTAYFGPHHQLPADPAAAAGIGHGSGRAASASGHHRGRGLEPRADREQRGARAGRPCRGRLLRNAEQRLQRGLVEGPDLRHAVPDLAVGDPR